ncbi:GMC family oxidoreductase [Mesorhizobium sp. B2-4-15]|uniref:GMC oxidoreductase n=1 Tax=Mesorhizobium sp. B2-4-15 TaxID=2589934 RepID=UPI00114DB898|nr:GMC family oxidoreductase [Mesorhizobium sp. B2-4-15]TPK60925.1 GMC family oxidoreductase [Mesorhizobium sp. B2-4-15]
MLPNHLTPSELTARQWDVAVIGTGIGGATLGYALAKAGRQVLFLERGPSYFSADAFVGNWLEALVPDQVNGLTPEQRRLAGRLAKTMDDVTSGSARAILPLLGIGTGGSSALYGMVMERFFPSDFEPGRYFRDAPGANVPETWPVTFDEFQPYYAEAETLYGVRATPDPFRPVGETRGTTVPPPLTPANREIFDDLSAKGLHPYRLPMACDFEPGCAECLGYVCARRCKGDSVKACLGPAVLLHGAKLVTDCEVETLESGAGAVTAINAIVLGERITIRAGTVVLAAGAVHSPAILLRSGGELGLANRSGQVGRNLMRHLTDYYLLYPRTAPNQGFLKQVAFNDFYECDGTKYGTVQSNGRFPPSRTVATYFRETMRETWEPLAMLFPVIRPFVERRVAQLVKDAHIMAAFLEDLPYAENRLVLSPDGKGLRLTYTVGPNEQARLREFRRMVAQAIAPKPFKAVRRAHDSKMLGHVCGTCRFGDDPRTSVLDRNNRAHEVANLYVVDSSFMPTSGGTNPSLTIAANALRVAAHILGESGAAPSRSVIATV